MSVKVNIDKEEAKVTYGQGEALEQYPYIDDQGVVWKDLICYYAPDNKKVFCSETGEIYDKAVELYPCKRHYYIYEEEPENENQLEEEVNVP